MSKAQIARDMLNIGHSRKEVVDAVGVQTYYKALYDLRSGHKIRACKRDGDQNGNSMNSLDNMSFEDIGKVLGISELETSRIFRSAMAKMIVNEKGNVELLEALTESESIVNECFWG